MADTHPVHHSMVILYLFSLRVAHHCHRDFGRHRLWGHVSFTMELLYLPSTHQHSHLHCRQFRVSSRSGRFIFDYTARMDHALFYRYCLSHISRPYHRLSILQKATKSKTGAGTESPEAAALKKETLFERSLFERSLFYYSPDASSVAFPFQIRVKPNPRNKTTPANRNGK